jgi:mannose-1-phosphate guanylyltransferase
LPASSNFWPAEHAWVTILAGGIGSRFWPASTPTHPKQLLALTSPRPLIVETVERARGLVPDARIRILAGEHLVAPFREVLPGLDADAFFVEPEARGTAPVLAWAAHELHRLDPEAVLISLHADHLIRPEAAFLELMRRACLLAARKSCLVTVGAVPDRPETGYGYIQPGPALDEDFPDAHRVEAFHEKPDARTAKAYLRRGYLWNTGIFVWSAATFLDEIREHAPAIAEPLARLDDGDVAGFFRACPRVSVDVAVLERSHRVATLPCTFSWDDVGSWEALGRTHDTDGRGNVTVGEATLVDASDNVIYAEGAPVVLFGVEGLVVVRTPDVTLVTRRDRSHDLKALLAELPAALLNPGEESS